MKKPLLLSALAIFSFLAKAQYQFTNKIDIETTNVKSQGRTGTCWSFSTTSFIEAEAMRLGHSNVDFAEMFNVYHVYIDKANNYISRQGKANFSEGSLAHDVLRTISKQGLVPQESFTGLMANESMYNHAEMVSALKGYLDGVLAAGKPSPKWRDGFIGILNAYMGAPKTEFNVDGRKHTPKSYANAMGIKADNYISITSFTHEPFYSSFILNIPDNYSNQSFSNLPLSELMKVVDHALENGYSIEWDGDVSEKGFGRKEGIAVLPADMSSKYFDGPVKEIEVTQELRQANFENQSTTDDHLMHLIGKAVDQEGNNYYIIKNSWGDYSPYGGLLYMSEAYFKMKTVSITLHKEAIPKGTGLKL